MTRANALKKKNELRMQAEAIASKRTQELYQKYPEIEEIDLELRSYGPKLILATMSGNKEEVESLGKSNLALQEKRKLLLSSYGLQPNEDEPHYFCQKCNDTGYVQLELCDCVKSLMSSDMYQSNGLGKGLQGKTFASFDLNFYQGEDREIMAHNLGICKNYVSNFSENSPSLLLVGKTGIGKTHISAAIGKELAEKGFYVLYETSQKLFDTYELSRFNRSPSDTEKAAHYETCDLLIIDDLGAECSSQYTSATFFNLLNTRLVEGKPMIISSNLTTQQLEKTYGERIYSRLLGEFRVLQFVGKDIRLQKVLNR